jgi:leucyl-tRNA synthetase
MILAFAYETKTGSKVPSDEVEEKDGEFYHKTTGDQLTQIVAKMSKSLKNVVNPDDVVKNFGADSLRLYEMFIGPLDATKPWTESGVKGVYNFLVRAYKFFSEPENIVNGQEDPEILKSLHQTIKKAESDIENLKFNTAISQFMIFTNLAIKKGKVTKETAEIFAKILNPFAPHMCEELWLIYGNKGSINHSVWPKVNEAYLVENTFEYPVSVNGKLRYKIEFPVDANPKEIETSVLTDERSQKWIENAQVLKVIVVPKKIINIVVKG